MVGALVAVGIVVVVGVSLGLLAYVWTKFWFWLFWK